MRRLNEEYLGIVVSIFGCAGREQGISVYTGFAGWPTSSKIVHVNELSLWMTLNVKGVWEWCRCTKPHKLKQYINVNPL